MLTRAVCLILGTTLLTAHLVAQPPAPIDPVWAELKALQDDQRKHTDLPGGSQPPRNAPPLPADDTDVTIMMGVKVICWYQFIPGVEGAKAPAPKPYESGATIRLLTLKDKKVLRQGKTTKSGQLRLAAPPGKYLLEIVPGEAGEGVQSPVEVTVRKEGLMRVEITITRSGV